MEEVGCSDQRYSPVHQGKRRVVTDFWSMSSLMQRPQQQLNNKALHVTCFPFFR